MNPKNLPFKAWVKTFIDRATKEHSPATKEKFYKQCEYSDAEYALLVSVKKDGANPNQSENSDDSGTTFVTQTAYQQNSN